MFYENYIAFWKGVTLKDGKRPWHTTLAASDWSAVQSSLGHIPTHLNAVAVIAVTISIDKVKGERNG